jgi:hypothetical protein
MLLRTPFPLESYGQTSELSGVLHEVRNGSLLRTPRPSVTSSQRTNHSADLREMKTKSRKASTNPIKSGSVTVTLYKRVKLISTCIFYTF